MAKLPKKPKTVKYPKKPKTTAPFSSWQKYDAACKAVDKKNAEKLSTWNKKISTVKSEKKKKEALIKKHAA